MPLIIESYFSPHTGISGLLFPAVDFTYVDAPISGDAPSSGGDEPFCYTRAELENCRTIRYCFNKIYYAEKGKIVFIHKSARQIRYYDLGTGKLIDFPKTEDAEKMDKSEFLPQLKAQDGEIVLFPEEDDEI